jgi:glycosyltransferase involved in cell wall biosynthesis
MRILWLCSIPLPAISYSLGKPRSVYGGWLFQPSQRLVSIEGTRLTVCYPCSGKRLESRVGMLEFRSIDPGDWKSRPSAALVARFAEILGESDPDLIHIWGTEYPHSLALGLAARSLGLMNRVLVSLQGLVSCCHQFYCLGIPPSALKRKTIRDILTGGGIVENRRIMEEQGLHETELLRMTRHIAGRTDWDRACAAAINPRLTYHRLDDTLRPSFYGARWAQERCARHSLFCSQGAYPLKGLHFALRALAHLALEFPDAGLRVAGDDTFVRSHRSKTSYGRHILALMRELDLVDRVAFLGALDEDAMVHELKTCNVFVSASSIENSSNSICEAMLLGVPIAASSVGGVPSLLDQGLEGLLHPADEPCALADNISSLFKNESLARALGDRARIRALAAHDPERNFQALMSVYAELLRGSKEKLFS